MNHCLKTLHILTRMLPSGGSERNTLYSVKTIHDSNYVVDVAFGSEYDERFLQLFNGIRLIEIKSFKHKINPIGDFKALYELYKVIKDGKYDIVHTHQTKAGIIGRVSAILARTPIIVHGIHGIAFPDHLNPLVRRFYILLERSIGYFTDYFVSVGEEIKQIYLQNGIGKENKYVVIHSGIELERFIKASLMTKEDIIAKKAELGLDKDDIVIGKVGRLEPDKGQRFVIESARRIVERYNKAKFLFVGDGRDHNELERLAADYNLEKNVIFTGHRDDIAEITGIFDVCVFCSLREGLPRVLVESAATGKPIVTFAVEGANEIVKSGVNGFVVPMKDIDSLTEKLSYLLENPDLARNMGLKGQEIVGDNWSIETVQKKNLEFYDRISANLIKR
jgi:glycosyltransferase involved in cell wall biosynthesis